ncbi:MAG: PD40 domain-containing protein [Bacteroidales bacterium]|nr:PD40 domain-containing protein [Bacteroidales bacterium]MBN2750011.1 PD40 domain-containing protein [Bacteroidales bacterium]
MRYFYATIFLFVLTVQATAQKNSYYKRVFVDAEYFLLYEEYKDALPLYQELLKADPENANINYRIGMCYLNILTEKTKAIPHLEKAITNTTNNYKEGYFTENKAPLEAYLLYGKALRIKGDFEQSEKAFIAYKNMAGNTPSALLVVNKEIEALAFAKTMMANPLKITMTSIGRSVNTQLAEVNPVVSKEKGILVYTSLQRFYNAILVSQFTDSAWSNPTNINTQTLADGPVKTVGLSGNGRVLVLARNDNDDYNLYYSKYDAIKKSWSSMVKFPKEINSRSWETSGSLSQSGDTLYFASKRPGGFGGLDIYMSVRTNDETWSQPVNLGKEINTPFDETAPIISSSGTSLYFASKGHETMGGYDIVKAVRANGSWTKPVNLGYPLNTTDDEAFFFPLDNERSGYMSRILEEDQREEDIYYIELDLPVTHPTSTADSSASITAQP